MENFSKQQQQYSYTQNVKFYTITMQKIIFIIQREGNFPENIAIL